MRLHIIAVVACAVCVHALLSLPGTTFIVEFSQTGAVQETTSDALGVGDAPEIPAAALGKHDAVRHQGSRAQDAKLEEDCRDANELCASWAAGGECAANPVYMKIECAVSCDSCEDLRVACDRVEGSRAIEMEPGGLNALFERAISSFPQYAPQVLSREPWVVSFDNFLKDEEGEAFLKHCDNSFVRSLAGDQLSAVRTSFQCWCSSDQCLRDPRIIALSKRVTELTHIQEPNAEYPQVLRYELNTFYRSHHDQNSAPWTPQGVRLLTLFMYINDVAEGGETLFNNLGLKVQARRGKAILWPSVLDRNLSIDEPKTYHEALPPLSNVKYAVNIWLHQHSFKGPSQKGCKFTTRNTK